ncbi:hypothetical protein MCEGE10_01692 [Flavobacteriaceae bacterium]
MKKITKQFLFCALSLSALTFVSCSKDDATGSSTLEVATGVIATVNFATPIVGMQTVNEGNDMSYDYTITLNKPQSKDIHFKVGQIAGTATSDDFTAEEVIIPAYATTATGSVSIVNDCEIEGTETLTLQMFDVTTANATSTPVTLSFTINNYLSDSLDLTFNFNKNFTIFGTALNMCGIKYDMDFYVLDSGLNDTGIYNAAASGCPEQLTFGSTVILNDPAATVLPVADGIYYIFYDVYDTGDLNGSAAGTPGLDNVYHDPFNIPISVDFERCGGINPGNFPQEAQFAPISYYAAGDQNDNGNFVIQIEMMNGVYTLSNSIPQAIASGRNANTIAAAIAHARRNNRK